MSLFHKITAEGQPLQRYTLYLLARRLEIPFLKITYKLLRGNWKWLGANRWVRSLYSAAVTRPLALHGDTAQPVPFAPLIAHIESLDCSIAVGPCRCRISHDPCGHPLETDIVIRTGTAAWLKAFPREYRVIKKSEAIKIVTDCHNLGMFHMLFFHCPSTGCAEYVICNCCRCGCIPYIINRDLGPHAFPFSEPEWLAVTDMDKCKGRADCVAACPFSARTIENGKAITHDCFGCGLCVAACPEKAISMKHTN
jgi:NAD-dependent dihydropyrimidine dehydrogenase PreA subunit